MNENETIYQKQPTVEPVVGGLPVPAGAAGASYISPRMRARMTELGLNAADLAGVAGTGAGGRVTVEDFEQFLRTLEQHRMTPASPMRMAVADAMRRSWTRPLATVGSPVMLDAMLAHRKKPIPSPAPRSTSSAPSRLHSQKTPPSPVASSATASCIPWRSISDSRSKWTMASWSPRSAM